MIAMLVPDDIVTNCKANEIEHADEHADEHNNGNSSNHEPEVIEAK